MMHFAPKKRIAKRTTPFNLAGLPYELQQKVAEQLDLHAYLNLKKGSKYAMAQGDRIRFDAFSGEYSEETCYFHRWLDGTEREVKWNEINTSCSIHVDLVALNVLGVPLDDKLCDYLITFLAKRRVTARELSCLSEIVCSVDSLYRLMRMLNVEALDTSHCQIAIDGIMQHPCLTQLKTVVWGTLSPIYRIPHEFFLSLRASVIRMPNIGIEAKSIQEFLKQWQRKERDIELLSVGDVYLESVPPADSRMKELVAGLKAVQFPGPVCSFNRAVRRRVRGDWFADAWMITRPGGVLFLQGNINRNDEIRILCFSLI